MRYIDVYWVVFVSTCDPEPPLDTDIPLPDTFIPEAPDPHDEIGSTYDEIGNILYWYNIQHKDGDMKLVMVETMHHDCMKQMLYMGVRDPRVPSSYDKGHPLSKTFPGQVGMEMI